MPDALKTLLSQLIGSRSVLEVARRADVNYPGIYAILDGRSKRPNPELLWSLARALAEDGQDPVILYRKLALAAYGLIYEPEGSADTIAYEDGAPPPETKDTWKRAGRQQQRVSTATS